MQVMHLDIKPQNVLLDRDLHVKLVDWGLAAAFTADRRFIILPQLGRGTRPYTAPEMLVCAPVAVSPIMDMHPCAMSLAALPMPRRAVFCGVLPSCERL